MTKFEHKVVELKPKNIWNPIITPEFIEEKLNEISKDGWELVDTIHQTSAGSLMAITFIFKRPAVF